MGVQLFLFGRFEVCREGQPLLPETWKNAKTQALLKILAGDRGRVFSADELIEYLWPSEELDVKSAASNLRSRVADLRKILEPTLSRGEQSHYILTQRGGYALSAESDCWVDAEEFSRLEEVGRRQHREGRFDEALSAFEKAVALYRGDYLAEDRYDDWALQLQERWRERFVEVLSLLADCLARRGQYRAAIGHLERALTRSVLHETLYRQLMIYAFCAGETARAHRAYEQCRAALERELGERPSSQTEEIYRQIQTGKIPGLERLYPEAAPEQFLSSLPQKIRRPPFVGRQNEWRHVTAALDKACSGEGRIVLIWGEAGVGKTRLGEEFLAWAQEKVGAHTLVGRSYELENPLPLHPWVEALREGISRLTYADLADLPPLWVAELSEILPELKRVIPKLPAAISLPPEHRQYRLFETLSRIVSSLALRQAPLVLLLDDLQWADAGSLDFLCYVIERLAKEPILILGTLRSEEVPRHLERLRHQGSRFGRLDEVHLTRLGEQEIHDLVKSLADELETTADFGGRLYQESVGNPLFAAAVLQALFENGAFVHEGNRWRLTDLSGLRLSSPAVGLIERRVTRVSAAAQRVLQLVACAVQIELAVLEEAWEGTPEELFVHLTELVAQGLLAERLGRYEFAHDKFREVVYESLEGPRRMWLHRQIAQAMERVYPDPAAAGFAGRLAQHYELGGQPLQALEWVFKAIEESKKSYHHEEGLQAVRQGMQLLQGTAARLPKAKRHALEYRLLEQRVTLSLQLGQLGTVESDLLRLNELAEDDRDQAQVHLLRADYFERTGRYREELEAAQQALRLYQLVGDSQGEIRALREQSLAYYYLGNSGAAIEGFQKILDIAFDPEEQLTALENLVLICRKQGDLSQGRDYLRKALQLATTRNLLDRESDLCYTSGGLEWQTGAYQAALRSFHQARHICQQTGDRYGTAYALLNLSITLGSLGDYRQALQYAQEAETLFTHLGNQLAQATAKRHLGRLHKALGDCQLAHRYVEEALQLSSQDHRRQGECFGVLGEIFLAEGQPQHALECAQHALAIAQRAQTPYPRIKVTLAEILLASGDAAGALKQCQQALSELSAWGGELVIQTHYQYYRALQVLNHPQAPDALRKAYDELQRTANQITDESLRASFLNIPLHREVLSAAHTLFSQQPKQKTQKSS